MGEERNAYRILVEKPEEKRPLGRPTSKWEDNIEMDLRETEWGGMDWIHLAQNRNHMEGSFEHGNEPPGSIKFWEIFE
jgi:hypothetical protein